MVILIPAFSHCCVTGSRSGAHSWKAVDSDGIAQLVVHSDEIWQMSADSDEIGPENVRIDTQPAESVRIDIHLLHGRLFQTNAGANQSSVSRPAAPAL